MAAVAPAAPASSAGSKRKVLLRLDDGSLIGDSTVLLNTSEAGAVLLEPTNAARVARAGQAELERLDKLLGVFRNKYPNAYLMPKSTVRNHNPYREEVRSGRLWFSVWARLFSPAVCLFGMQLISNIVMSSVLAACRPGQSESGPAISLRAPPSCALLLRAALLLHAAPVAARASLDAGRMHFPHPRRSLALTTNHPALCNHHQH